MLLLPPRLPASAGDAARAAADAACDRLAQDLAAAGVAHVVDRTQIDRILQERRLHAGPSRPMLSYDAMIRLEADTSRLAPETTLSLIDLSTGSVIAQQTFAWPPKEDAAKAMLDFCRDALQHVAKPAAGKLRVRTLWATEAIDNERLRPLGGRLIDVFNESLRRSERVVLIRHLEAATAKEESLLLLMGLSRLPGGRQFTPQADATIELRVVEGEGRGKTFSDTPVEIGVRLRKGARYEGDWVTTVGLVRDFDAMIPQAWRKLAQALGEVRPETAATLLEAMSLRRKQAEAELQTVQELRKSMTRGTYDEQGGFLLTALPHAEAALKLDPTSTEAVRVYVDLLTQMSKFDLKRRWMPDAPLRMLREAARYMERYRQDAGLCNDLCECAFWGTRTQLGEFLNTRVTNDPLPPFPEAPPTMTPELVQALDAMKRLLERGVEDDVTFRFETADRILFLTARGMRSMSVPAAEREAWLETIARRCLEKAKRGQARATNACDDWRGCIALQFSVAAFLLEDGQRERAKQVIARAQSAMPRRYVEWDGLRIAWMRRVVGETDDARLLADFDAWIKGGRGAMVCPIVIGWPAVDAFAIQEGLDHPDDGSDRPPLRPRPGGVESHRDFFPLAEGDGRLYIGGLPVFQGNRESAPRLACVSLNGHGRPTGDIEDISPPNWKASYLLTSAQYVDGKLCVATQRDGIQVFDPKTETWKSYGPEQGLPSRGVDQIFSIGGHVLYGNTAGTHFTLDIAGGAVMLLHRPAPKAGWPEGCHPPSNLRLVWRQDGQVMGIDEVSLQVDLLGKVPQGRPLPSPSPYGWHPEQYHDDGVLLGPLAHIVGAVEVEGRRFCLFNNGLCEIDAAGKPLRTWGASDNMDIYWLWVATPADSPIPVAPRALVAVGPRLILTSWNHLIVYDPKTDTWYGPLDISVGERLLVDSHGMLWTGGGAALGYLAIDDAVAYAQRIGRVMTTTEYRRRKQQFIDAAEPLERAKFNLGMRHFDKAKAAFQEVLDAQPNQPEALILMGFLYDRVCLNQLDEAIKYYRRAAALEDNPSASYSAMYFWMRVLEHRQQWQEMGDLCEQILHRFPTLQEPVRWHIERFRDHSRQQLAAKNAKQPAPATSNKPERPAK